MARVALDQFILWVNAETPYKTAREYLAAVKEKPGAMKMGGTGSAQEDQIITILLEQAQAVKFTYVPFKGGGEVCVNLVGKHVDSTVNNPIECASHWKAGRVRPLAVFDSARISVAEWKDIPTIKEALGADITYLMLRGVFGPPDMPKEAVAWYQDLLKKVAETPEFHDDGGADRGRNARDLGLAAHRHRLGHRRPQERLLSVLARRLDDRRLPHHRGASPQARGP